MGGASTKSAPNQREPEQSKNTEMKQLDDRHRNVSGRSGASYGATNAGDSSSSRASLRRQGSSGAILKRTSSTATTDRPYERSEIRSMASGKSLASIRTRRTSISRSEYHVDLKPTLVSGLNLNLISATTVIIFGSSFLFGYNIGVLNQPNKLIKQFYNETYTERYGNISESTVTVTWSLTTAIFIPGGMIGAFLGGWLADKIGRKRTILFSHVFAFLGALASCSCVAAKSPELLMVGRILVGVNSGLGNCIAPMFLSEIAPFNYRGAFGTLHQLFVTFGIFFSSVFGIKEILGTRDLWPFLILLEVVPAFVSLVVLPFLPESPRFLLLVRQNRDGAASALRFYRKRQEVDADMEEMDTEDQQKAASVGGETKEFSLKELFICADLRRPLFIASMLQVIQQFSGINAVFFYSESIFDNARVKANDIPFAIIGTNAVNVFMTIVTVPLMDIAGRRLLLLVPMIAMVVDLIVMTVCLVLQATWKQDSPPAIAYVTIACVIIYVIAFAVGLGPIPMMIGAELFRQGPRPKAMAVAGVVNWIGTFIIAIGFESVQKAAEQYTFLIFIVLLSAFVVFTYFFVPETKNKTFEEIAHQFSPGGHLEVEEMVDDVFAADADAIPNEEADQEDHQLVTLNFTNQPPSGQTQTAADVGAAVGNDVKHGEEVEDEDEDRIPLKQEVR